MYTRYLYLCNKHIHRALSFFKKAKATTAVELKFLALRFLDPKAFQAKMAFHKEFITSLYRETLFRDPDLEGLAAHLTQLSKGYISPDQMREVLRNSAEYQMLIKPLVAEIKTLYAQVLLRQPTEQEIMQYIDQFRGKFSTFEESVQALQDGNIRVYLGIQSLIEWKELVSSLYREVLFRDPDLEGLAAHIAQLSKGYISPDQVREVLRNSAEYQMLVKPLVAEIKTLYTQVLLREPTQQEIMHHTNRFRSKFTTFEDSVQALQDGNIRAYLDIRSLSEWKELITSLYREVLFRDPDTEVLAGYLKEQRSPDQLREALRNSAEYQMLVKPLVAEIKTLYAQVLLREPTQQEIMQYVDQFRGRLSTFEESVRALQNRSPEHQRTMDPLVAEIKTMYAQYLSREPTQQEIMHHIIRLRNRFDTFEEAVQAMQNGNIRTYLGVRPQIPLRAGKTPGQFFFKIDVIGFCNLRCPSCPVGNWTGEKTPNGFMEPDFLRRIIEKACSECDPVGVELFNWTEPLLHPKLPELVRIVQAHQVPCYLSSNLNVPARLFEPLLGANPYSFRISTSGFTQEVYGFTHKGGNIERVKRNMEALVEARAKTGATTRIHVLYHLYLSNLKDAIRMRIFAEGLGINFQPVWAYLMPIEKVLAYFNDPENLADLTDQDLELIKRLALPLREAVTLSQKHNTGECLFQEEEMVLDYRGNVQLCCSVYDVKKFGLGSYLDVPLSELQNLKYRHSMCGKCMSKGLHVYYAYGAPGLDDLATNHILGQTYASLAEKTFNAEILNVQIPNQA